MPLIRRKALSSKSGTLLPGAFSGSPKVAAVAFASAYTAGYAVAVDIETGGARVFAHTIKNLTAAGFQIEICADNIGGIVRVSWQTKLTGEE